MDVTIKDIAREAKVSITTVSKVMNHKTHGIGKATQERVWKIIKEMEYQPNSIARSMITKKTYTTGLVIPDIRNPFFPELVRGVEDLSNSANYTSFLCNTDGSSHKEQEYIKILIDKKVDGIFFTGSHETDYLRIQRLVEKSNTPLILLDRGQEIKQISGVYVDNVKTGYLATKHLLEFSHRKIGCITGPASIPNSMDRLKGYLKALSEYRVAVDDSMIINGNYQMEGGYQAAKKLLKERKVTAIFAFNDLMAFGVYRAAMELGLKIPQDLSIVGVDNVTYNQLLAPKLTTIEQSAYKMGKTGAGMLLEYINKGRTAVKQLFIEPSILINESTNPI